MFSMIKQFFCVSVISVFFWLINFGDPSRELFFFVLTPDVYVAFWRQLHVIFRTHCMLSLNRKRHTIFGLLNNFSLDPVSSRPTLYWLYLVQSPYFLSKKLTFPISKINGVPPFKWKSSFIMHLFAFLWEKFLFFDKSSYVLIKMSLLKNVWMSWQK